ncbi:MAG: class I SAM-dependent methyltransferase [Nanobdellota archaeon]
MEKIKLNLGCGRDNLKGYINCDWSDEVGADKIMDLNKRFPFKDNYADEILLSHVLEHFHEPLKILKEVYRVCKDGAIVTIRVPYFSHESAFSMLDHYHQFTWTSFDGLEENHACHWQSVGNFKTVDKKLVWRKQLFFLSFFNLFPRVYQELFCWIFPARELHIKLKAVKERN